MEQKESFELSEAIQIIGEDGNSSYTKTIYFDKVLRLKHLKKLPMEIFDFGEGEEIPMSVMFPAMPKIIACLANIPPEAAEEIALKDLESLMEKVGSFLGEFQTATGKKEFG